MSADDWQDACDPVPARRELTDAEKSRLQAFMKARRKQRFSKNFDSVMSYRVEPAFDELEG